MKRKKITWKVVIDDNFQNIFTVKNLLKSYSVMHEKIKEIYFPVLIS